MNPSKKKQRTDTKKDAKRIKSDNFTWAIEKNPILLSQYWKNEWLDGTITISYFVGRNNIFADCIIYFSLTKDIVDKFG